MRRCLRAVTMLMTDVPSLKCCAIALSFERGVSTDASLKELCALLDTLGNRVVEQRHFFVRNPCQRTILRSGLLEELLQLCESQQCDGVVFDCDLSPSQQRNLERYLKRPVIDRAQVILDVFHARAQTKEARLQVALARAQYMLPRLTKLWSHLSRQKGGSVNQKGEGEKQIELDRRMLQKRIEALKIELQSVRSNRQLQTKKRSNASTPTFALMGYTNAGKTTLFNSLTRMQNRAVDQLFATLDPCCRQFRVPESSCAWLITDTVGFIRRLPHTLIAAFRSTLEASMVADVLVCVYDASDPDMEVHYQVVHETLQALQGTQKPTIHVMNKADLLSSVLRRKRSIQYPGAVFLEANNPQSFTKLFMQMQRCLQTQPGHTVDLLLRPEAYSTLLQWNMQGAQLQCDFTDGNMRVTGWVPERWYHEVLRYTAKSSDDAQKDDS